MITSLPFWLLLILGVPLFWLTPARWRLGLLAFSSFAFVLWQAPLSALSLLGWSLAFYYLAPQASQHPKSRITTLLVLGILAYLAYFKYVPPLVAALTDDSPATPFLVPLGISYFTFKLIHYGVEISRGNIKDRSLQQFYTYLFLFPIYTAGPIERFDHFLANQEKTWSLDATVEGCSRIIQGLVKKLVIGGIVLEGALKGLSIPYAAAHLDDLAPHTLWRVCIVSFLMVYFDFSAYSDIAIGSSRLFGLRIAENFNWPFFATNIGEFWKRWHMTLAGWCQAYVYMPMIGLTRNPYIAIYSTFAIMGLWHSGSINYLAWGLWHATGVSAHLTYVRYKRKRKWTFADNRWGSIFGALFTLLFVSTGGALAATDGIATPYAMLRLIAKMFFVSLP
jgi:alginate O-acetyltransferase complex protein AlgI